MIGNHPKNIEGGRWYPENRGSRKILAWSRNLGNVSTESRRLVFFLFGSEIAWVLGSDFQTRVSASLGFYHSPPLISRNCKIFVRERACEMSLWSQVPQSIVVAGCEALWNNIANGHSQANRDYLFLCVRNMNSCFTSFACYTAYNTTIFCICIATTHNIPKMQVTSTHLFNMKKQEASRPASQESLSVHAPANRAITYIAWRPNIVLI